MWVTLPAKNLISWKTFQRVPIYWRLKISSSKQSFIYQTIWLDQMMISTPTKGKECRKKLIHHAWSQSYAKQTSLALSNDADWSLTSNLWSAYLLRSAMLSKQYTQPNFVTWTWRWITFSLATTFNFDLVILDLLSLVKSLFPKFVARLSTWHLKS